MEYRNCHTICRTAVFLWENAALSEFKILRDDLFCLEKERKEAKKRESI